MLNFATAFPGRSTPASPDYPQGSAKDETTSGAGDGSPILKSRSDDILGFQQALVFYAGITPSGNADTAKVSDQYDALVKLFLNKKIRTVNSSEAILITDKIVLGNSAGGDVVLSTPTAAAMIVNGSSIEITVKKIDTSSAFKITVEDIEGEDWDLEGDNRPYLKFISDGTTKYLVG